MPLHEYVSELGNRREILISISDPIPDTLEENGEVFRRRFSAPGVVFRGSGWTTGAYSNADSVDRWKWDELDKY